MGEDQKQDMIGPSVPRRDFLRQVGAGMIGGSVLPGLLARAESSTSQPAASAPASRPADVGHIRDIPKRRLGRVGVEVPVLGIGTGPMGHAFYEQEPFTEVIDAAIDAGAYYIDTSPMYDIAADRLGPIVAKRRKEIFLVSKSYKRTRDEVLADMEACLKRLRTDYLDIGHLHNIGDATTEQVIGKGGALDGMLEARKRGWIRHIGCTGHLRPDRFAAVIETGEIEVVMCVLNFVDCHTYNFEEKVLPAVRKHGCGLVCMKVYGGVTGGWDGYKMKRPGRLAGDEHRQDAFDYCLSIPGAAACVVGIKSLHELRCAITAIRNHRPLEGARRDAVLAKGAVLAREWGPHFGPVAES